MYSSLCVQDGENRWNLGPRALVEQLAGNLPYFTHQSLGRSSPHLLFNSTQCASTGLRPCAQHCIWCLNNTEEIEERHHLSL